MKKTLRLTESELVSLVKRIISEAAPEPQYDNEGEVVIMNFPEGGSALSPQEQQMILNRIEPVIERSIPTIKKFLNSEYELPKMFDFYAGTSSTGTPEQNAKVARARIATAENLVRKAFAKYGVRADRVQQLISMSTEAYNPSKLDTNFYDSSMVPPKGSERKAILLVNGLTTRGLDRDQMKQVQRGLRNASGSIRTPIFDTQNEEQIVQNIYKLKSRSDIAQLNDAISSNTDFGSLENFISNQLYDDPREMQQVVDHLNRIAIRSGLPDDSVRSVGNRVTISRSLFK